mgnify:CR=1 FL=1
MLDIKFIRDNKDLVQAGARKKHIDFDVEALILADDKRKEVLQIVEAKRMEQNSFNDKISSAQNPEERQQYIDTMKVLKASLENDEEKLKEAMREWQRLMLAVPNIPDMSVPDGESDKDNREVRVWGEKPQFPFTPKGHIELMETLNILDLKKGSEVAGFRGYFLKNEGALLSFALWQFVIDYFSKKGWSPMIVPSLLRREAFLGTGYLPQGEEDLYKTQDDTYLAGTSEVSAMGYFMDRVLEKKDLPIKVLAFSPCFRREAGAHGKDTSGIYRLHEFFKLEQIVLCEANHEASVKLHEEITLNAEEIMQALNIPYRVVVNCGADLGLGQVKKYDIESWRPSLSAYGETHSASYFHDFQSRRLNIKYKEDDGKTHFVHSLNNTAIATPRILISLIENYQQADGTILIPKPLRMYMGGQEHIGK